MTARRPAVTPEDLHFGSHPHDPTGVRDCQQCAGAAVIDGELCPSCHARQQLRTAWFTSGRRGRPSPQFLDRGDLGHVQPLGDRDHRRVDRAQGQVRVLGDQTGHALEVVR